MSTSVHGSKARGHSRVLTAAAILALVLTANVFAQEVDARVPIVVNVGASVTIAPPAVGRGTGDEGTVTANTQRPFDIKLVSRPLPEEVLAPSSASHRPRARAGTGAWISHNRGNVTLNLQSQQYQNAAIALYSINGKRVLAGKASASGGALNISRSNVPAGVYLLSVKGANGNSFASRVTHGGNRLNINIAFSDGTAGRSLSKSMADEPDYGEWTITVTAPGHITYSRKFSPVAGANPAESFELTPIEQTGAASFIETVNGVSFDMVYIPGGAFRLGCTASSGCPANTTPVDATVSPYFIGKATVTRDLWIAVMGAPPTGFGVGGTWYDALEFACKLSQLTGKNYRMTTEAEWEYAAKNHLRSLDSLTTTEEWAYNTWNGTHMGGTDPVGPGSGTHNQKTRRNAQGTGDNITGRLIRSIEGIGPALRLTLSANGSLPPEYIHPCRIYAPEMAEEPVNSYRDPRWITGSGARWSGINLMVWEDGTARTGSGTTGGTVGQWFTSNNYTLVFVPNSGAVTRYAYIFLDEGIGTYLNSSGMSGRTEKRAVDHVAKPAVTNLRRGEDLARAQPDFNTLYRMVDMVNVPEWAKEQDRRLLDGPDSGWVQFNAGSAHHYRKDIDPDEFRFRVSGAWLANGAWFTVNNTFLRVIHPGGDRVCRWETPPGGRPTQVCRDADPYVVDYLYVVPSNERFLHNSFMGYERGDMRVFTKTANSASNSNTFANSCTGGRNNCVDSNGELLRDRVAEYYRGTETGESTFIPAPCPPGGCR